MSKMPPRQTYVSSSTFPSCHLLTVRSQAHEALHFLASLMYGKHGTPRGTARKTNVIGSFFENHVLGIMAYLSDTINENKGVQITAEKIRCLRAIQEMIKIAKSNVNNALPQVFTLPRTLCIHRLTMLRIDLRMFTLCDRECGAVQRSFCKLVGHDRRTGRRRSPCLGRADLRDRRPVLGFFHT